MEPLSVNAPNNPPDGSSGCAGDHSGADLRRLTFPAHFRIRKGTDFQTIFAHGRKASDAVLVLIALKNDRPYSRLGLSVSKRNGNSVARHRLRRLLREAFRLEQWTLPAGLDLILIPGRAAREASQAAIRSSLVSLARRVERQFREGPAGR
jgi:ribonuclease P protein component